MITAITLLIVAIFVGYVILNWENIKKKAKNCYAYLFLDDTKYYWTSLNKPIYVNNNQYPNHAVIELRGYWKDGVYHEINPNIPFKKEMIDKFEGCKIYTTIVNMDTRELSYVDFIINQSKFW